MNFCVPSPLLPSFELVVSLVGSVCAVIKNVFISSKGKRTEENPLQGLLHSAFLTMYMNRLEELPQTKRELGDQGMRAQL